MAAKDETDTLGSTPLVPKKAGNPLVPVIAVVVLVPVLCYGVMDFVIIPKLKTVAESAPAAAPAHGAAKKKEGGGHGGKGETAKDAEFGLVVVNLSGSGSSRYLRTNFFVKSADPKIADILKENQSALRDAAITVLSAQTPSSLENNGRDIVRKALISQFNRVLGAEVVDQIYFSEFVIQ